MERTSPEVSTEIQIVLLGNPKSGKSALVEKLAQHSFADKYAATVGVDYDARVLEVDGSLVKLHLWDVSGQESFLWLAAKHIRQADAIIYVYDVTDSSSFVDIPRWRKHVKRCSPDRKLPEMLLGNKQDLRHKAAVTASQAKEWAIPEGLQHIEVSARTGRNVSAALYMLSRDVLRHRQLGTVVSLADMGSPRIEIHEDPAMPAKLGEDEQGPEYAYMFRVLMLGATRTGKTALRYRFCKDHFNPEYYTTAGFDYNTRTLLIDGERVRTQIWDISGDSIYDQTRKGYYRGANAFIIVYDVTSPESFKQAEMILKELDMYEQSDAPKIIVGNKCDINDKRRVDYFSAREWADGWRVPLVEVSARNGANVDAAFFKVTMALKRQLAPWKRLYDFS